MIAGNWKRFECFCWHDAPEDADAFAIVYHVNRDSDVIARANAETIEKTLASFPEDAIPQHHGHWACGWVDGYAIRVGSKAEEVYDGLMARLADYPVLDEGVLSRLESEEWEEGWRAWGQRDYERELEEVYGEGLVFTDSRATYDAVANRIGVTGVEDVAGATELEDLQVRWWRVTFFTDRTETELWASESGARERCAELPECYAHYNLEGETC